MTSFLTDVKRLARFLVGHAHWVVFGRIYTSASALLFSVLLSRVMPIDVCGQFLSLLVVFYIFSGSEDLSIMFAFLYLWKVFLSLFILVSSKWILNRG
tara:strand:- start:526 stop:819 length:294 start_codon:yes stop_codon:yes gene_type:complete